MTVTDRIRWDVGDAVRGAQCVTCGQTRPPVPIRQVAREAGVAPSTLFRFLQGGVTRSGVLDLLDDWVIKHKANL